MEFENNDKTQISALKTLTDDTVDLQDVLVQIYPPGPSIGKKWELSEQDMLIGRDSSCKITVEHNSVSRRHANLSKKENNRILTDLKSTNGSFVNSKQIQTHTLNSGDRIKIGDTIFKYLMGSDVETAYHEEIYRMTIIDGLTNIYNKRHFMDTLEKELARSMRYARPLSLIMFDIDFFKSVNDEHGHLAGDYILHEMAGLIQNRMRRDELFARYGGEEFVILTPESPLDATATFAEMVRTTVQNSIFTFENSIIPITISLGVACCTGEQTTVSEFIKQADIKLYQAKNQGRNCVCK